MANLKLSQLAAQTSIAASQKFLINDTADTTMSPTGTNKTVSGAVVAGVAYVDAAIIEGVGFINAADYGTVGDGVANDTAALQAAIAAAKASGKTLFIPAGTYLLTAALVVDWKGAFIQGAGGSYHDGGTTLLCGTDISALSIATDSEGVTLDGFRVKGPGVGSSTKAGIHFVLGAGTNTDHARVCGVSVRDFAIGIRADDVANSVFIDCDLSINEIGFSSTGNSNSNTLIDCSAMQCATSSLKLSGGAPWTVIGGDLGGSGNAKPVDISAVAVTLIGVNFEAHPASSGTLIDLAASCSLVLNNCYMNWLGGGGTKPFIVTQAASSSLTVMGGSWNFSDSVTNSAVKHVTSIGIYTQAVGQNVFVQQYVSGVAQTRFLASVLTGQTGNDGVAADANTMGTFRVRHTTPTELQYFYKTAAGGYGIANLLQYVLDVTAGVAAKTNVANAWTEHQTMAFGKSFIVGRATGSTGGVFRWNEDVSNGASRAWHIAGEAYDWNSWALMRSSARGADPTIFMWYADGANNRTHIGHTGTTPSTGIATLNVAGLGTLLLNPQSSAPTGAKGMLYCNTAGTLHFHDGTAWRTVTAI